MKTNLLLMLGMVLFFVERGVGQCPADNIVIGEVKELGKIVYLIKIPFRDKNAYTSFTVQNGEDNELGQINALLKNVLCLIHRIDFGIDLYNRKR